MRVEPFRMERWQSTYEHDVELNLSDSGVHPLTPRELVEDELEALLDERLIYTQTNGTPELRERIAALYPDTSPDEVLVTNGGAEANLIAAWSLVEPGDEVCVTTPNYMQLPGIVAGFGARVRPWPLTPEWSSEGRGGQRGRWRADLEQLSGLVNDRSRLICLCNPNNPTGARLEADDLDRVCRIAERHGAWVLADEIYQGSELDGSPTATVRGRTGRAIVTNSLSKTYGLPGLRLGWIVAPREAVAGFWERHDYTTIGPGALSDRLARAALAPDRRAALLARTRGILSENLAHATSWVGDTPGLRCIPPDAGAMLFVNYDHRITSLELAERLRDEKSLLLVPGEHFDLDGWFRIGFGDEKEKLSRGLERIGELLAGLPRG